MHQDLATRQKNTIRENLLYSSGPLVTHEGGGFEGADLSVVQNTSLGLSLWGYTCTIGNRACIQEIIIERESAIEEIMLFGYATNAPTEPVINDLRMALYDVDPETGAEPFLGNLDDNVLENIAWSGMYRAVEEAPDNTHRPVSRIIYRFEEHLMLPAGTYWIWFEMSQESAGLIFTPPVTVPGEAATGNARQFGYSSGLYEPIFDAENPQGLPVRVYGRYKPAAPMLALSADNAIDIPLSQTFTWVASEFAETYQFQLSTDNGFADIVRDEQCLENRAVIISGLQPNTIYYWRVRGVQGTSITSEWSESRLFTTQLLVPEQVVLIHPENNGAHIDSDPEFSWLDAEFADTYDFQLALDPNFQTLVDNREQLGETTLTRGLNLDENQQYYWRVRASNLAGNSSWSETWTFNTDIVVSAGHEDLPVRLLLHQNYPNPFNPVTTIRFEVHEPGQVKISVYSEIGELVATLIDQFKNPGIHTIHFDAR